MPTRRQLEEAGRKDLVRLIIAAGGFLDVATTLGFRSARRPPGYWENESNLDRELSMFVAAHWIKFEGKKSKLRQRVPDTIQSSTESMSLMQGRQMGLQWYTTEDDLDDDEETDDDRYQEEPTYWYNQVSYNDKHIDGCRMILFDESGLDLLPKCSAISSEALGSITV